MKGPFRRIRLRRRTSAPASQGTEPTVIAPAQEGMTQPLPAGVTPQDVAPSKPSFRDRGRLRRRLRYLRRVRELGFRDLGGLVFDLHRFGRRADELVLGKLSALSAVDREMRALERALDERRDIIELREPGIAACPRCGGLHGSEARFCPSCGTPLGGPLAFGEVGEGPHAPPPSPGEQIRPLHAAGPAGATPVSAALAGEAGQGGEPGGSAPSEARGADSATREAGRAEAATSGEPGVAPSGAGDGNGNGAGDDTVTMPVVEPADRQP
jgi:hypothetical protein